MWWKTIRAEINLCHPSENKSFWHWYKNQSGRPRPLIPNMARVRLLCAPVFTFISSSSALLGCPWSGLSISLSLPVIFNTPFWVDANFYHEKTSKTAIFVKCPLTVTKSKFHSHFSDQSHKPHHEKEHVKTSELQSCRPIANTPN